MAVAEQQLSPEEKLLKVIQGGGDAEKQPTPEEKLLSAVKPPNASPPVPTPVPKPPRIEPPARPVSAKPEPPWPAATPPAQKPAAPVAAVEPPKKAVVARPPQPASAAPQNKEEKKGAEGKPPAPELQEKPKLKVLKQDDGAEGKEPPAKTLIGAPDPKVAVAGGAPVVTGTRRTGGRFTIGTVNRSLAAVVLLVLGLTGYEIWATAREVSSVARGSDDKGDTQQPDDTVLQPEVAAASPTLASIVDPWKEKDPFYRGNEPVAAPDGRAPAPAPEMTGRLKLMGFSRSSGESKVVLWDAKDGKMFIIKTGDKILVGEQPLELVQMQDDHVVLSDGKDSITVK